MVIQLKKLLILALGCALLGSAGCTTMETVHGSPEALEEKRIRVGDKVTLHYTSGHSEPVKLTAIGPESLSALADDGRRIEVKYEDLLSLDHKKVEVLKTAGATLGVIVLGAVVVVGAGAGAAAAVMAGG
ncbi:MAG: hypothetical protein ACR2QS_15480 [Woeseiaceae bacterium]